MFSKEEVALAKPYYEAIKKISKRGINPMTGAPLTVPEWEWHSRTGEFAITKENRDILLVTHLLAVAYWQSPGFEFVNLRTNEKGSLPDCDCIPLLHWERIEHLLEGMGYELDVFKSVKEHLFVCSVHRNSKIVLVVRAKSRQLAVMRAVIELRKESNHEPHKN